LPVEPHPSSAWSLPPSPWFSRSDSWSIKWQRSSTSWSRWAAWPFAATGLIVALDFLTGDATLSAQVFLIFPALYAASELRRPGAVAVVVAVVIAEWSVTTVLLPWERAIVEASYMTAAIVTTAALLTLAGERQERLVALLERQAAIDPLTGLVTRRVLDEAARTSLSGAASDDGTALILIDVDKFKGINDQYGHPGGDEVLVQLAQVLIGGSRSTDVVSRLGGDEIALLIPGCSAVVLAARGQQILGEIRARRFTVTDGRDVAVSVSGGLAHAPTDAVDLRSLYAAADRALYRAKALGRNRIYAALPSDELRELSAWIDRPVTVDAARRATGGGEIHP
jgi:diguanylate cyclase (GGDEF)-like protein